MCTSPQATCKTTLRPTESFHRHTHAHFTKNAEIQREGKDDLVLDNNISRKGAKFFKRLHGSYSARVTHYSRLTFFAPPPRQRRSPPPINRGRAPSGHFSHSAWVTYYLLLTTYYLNSYFLSFFSPFTEKTLTIFNIHPTCFVN